MPARPDALVPDGFRFGVATAGFQIEGGYNGPDEPANNWAAWERAGRIEPSGEALDFWNRYEEHLDRAASLGCDAFRLSVEWARVMPAENVVDHDVLARYGDILRACAARGLRPLVTLHHFTHPAWLGPDLWLRPDAPERFVSWVITAVGALGEGCDQWVTLNELNILAVQTYLDGSFPPGRRGDLAAVVRAVDTMLTAHVLAYAAIHRLQPDAVVSTNNFALSIYELDRLPLDIAASRGLGVTEDELDSWLAQRRAEYLGRQPVPTGRVTRALEAGLRRVARGNVPLSAGYPRATAAVLGSDCPRLLDVSQVDYYNPVAASHFRVPGHATAGGRHLEPARALWDDPPDPDGLVRYCAANHMEGLDVWIVENGMCNRVRRGRSYPRLDLWDRARYLRANLAAVTRAVAAGVPVTGYWHWTLADNYEWGSYEPRFGLFGVDRDRGVRWRDTDAMGVDAAGAYRTLIEGLRAGDASVLGDSRELGGGPVAAVTGAGVGV